MQPIFLDVSNFSTIDEKVIDEDGIRTHAGRAQWISSPSRGRLALLNVMQWLQMYFSIENNENCLVGK